MKGWLRGLDLNQRPLGYEPNELPDCSTPHSDNNSREYHGQISDRVSPSISHTNDPNTGVALAVCYLCRENHVNTRLSNSSGATLDAPQWPACGTSHKVMSPGLWARMISDCCTGIL